MRWRPCAEALLATFVAGCSRPAPAARFDERTVATVIELRSGGEPLCSGVRIAPALVLTAAHCVVGFTGQEQRAQLTVAVGGVVRTLHVVELGAFDPDRGQMADFALLGGDPLPADVPIAALATRDELAAATRVGDALDSREVHVHAVGFAQAGRRSPPRPAPDGIGVFVSEGYLKSASAYRRAAVLAVQYGFIFDEAAARPLPREERPLDEAWASMQTHGLHRMFRKYERAGRPILYHSADYTPGASGGGVFLDSGRLLGIVPFGTSAVPRPQEYPGFGQLYRIDHICRASKLLASHRGCAALR